MGKKQKYMIKLLQRIMGKTLILITEHRISSAKNSGLYDVPNCKVKRPETDVKRLEALGFKIIRCEQDVFRDHGLEYLKYGWQSKHFVLVAEKPL